MVNRSFLYRLFSKITRVFTSVSFGVKPILLLHLNMILNNKFNYQLKFIFHSIKIYIIYIKLKNFKILISKHKNF